MKSFGSGDVFRQKIIDYIKSQELIDATKPDVLFDSTAVRTWNQRVVQEKMYGKRNVTIVFKTGESVYMTYLSKVDGRSNDDDWMKDSEFYICSLFRNDKEKFEKYVRKQGDDEDDDISSAYGLFEISNTNVEIIQTYSGYTIMKNKKVKWDEDFYTYYECDDNGNKRDFFDKASSKNGNDVSELFVIQWK